MQHFITGTEFSKDQLMKMIQLAVAYKNGAAADNFKGKILTLIFANPSLRTRLSFESGMKKLGGGVNVLNASDTWQFEYEDGKKMDGDCQEHIKEAARVISTYSDIIALRKSDLMVTKSGEKNAEKTQSWDELRKDEAIRKLAYYAQKPVINMESNMYHPCQSMADMMTMCEHFGEVAKKKYVLTWAPHPKPLPLATPHSQLLMPCLFGMHVTLVYPPGFHLDAEVIEKAQTLANENNGTLTVTHNQKEAFENADVVVAKSWASLQYFGKWDEEKQCRSQFSDWIVDSKKMSLTNNAIFLHCLPVRRNVVVSDEVLDSPNSLIIQEAENRMWIQMAIIKNLLNH